MAGSAETSFIIYIDFFNAVLWKSSYEISELFIIYFAGRDFKQLNLYYTEFV